MLFAQAQTFQQQSRLAVTLAWVAGYTNIVTVLICGTVTSHLSGTTSNLGSDLVRGQWMLAAFAAALIGSFVAGAALAGASSEFARRMGWTTVYVLPMGIEAAMLGVVAILLESNNHLLGQTDPMLWAIACFAAVAMGLQNAAITRISGGVVRTTHVTGVVTDLGLEMAHFCFFVWDQRRRAAISPRMMIRKMRGHASPRRLFLLAAIFGSFALGAALGTLAHLHFLRFAMFPPVVFLLWVIYLGVSRPVAELEREQRVALGGDSDVAGFMEVYRIRRQGSAAKPHRLPNLRQWATQLEDDTKVVILEFGADSRIGKSAIVELRAIYLTLRENGKRLIFSGLRDDVYEQIVGHWGDDLRESMVFPDLAKALERLSPPKD